MSHKLYVGNLSYGMTENDLQALFEPHGKTTSIKIIVDKVSGRSKGFGFVEFESAESAKKAIEALHQSEVSNRKIVVSEAKPREDGGGGGHRGGGGFRGGNR